MKRSTFLKKDLISKDSGTVVGPLDNMVIDFEAKKVIALVVDQGARGKQVVLPSDVASIGDEAVMIEGPTALRNFDDEACKEVLEHLRARDAFSKIDVCTTNGNVTGHLHDAEINESTWAVEHYVVSIGLLGNVLKGFGTLAVKDIETVHEERFMVSEDCATSLEAADGGLTGGANSVGDVVSRIADKASSAVKAVIPGVSGNSAEGASAETLMEEHTKEELYDIAKEEDIDGRSTMNKKGLAEAIEAETDSE